MNASSHLVGGERRERRSREGGGPSDPTGDTKRAPKGQGAAAMCVRPFDGFTW